MKKEPNRNFSGVDDLTQHAFELMAKPAGPDCNLRCNYCFYLEKKVLFPRSKIFRMPDDVLEAYTRKYIESQPGPSVVFAWQGGEPTLVGSIFFAGRWRFRKNMAWKNISPTHSRPMGPFSTRCGVIFLPRIAFWWD